MAAAGVTGRPLSITTLRLKTRLPGVAAEARSSNTIGYSHSQANSRISQIAMPIPPMNTVTIATA